MNHRAKVTTKTGNEALQRLRKPTAMYTKQWQSRSNKYHAIKQIYGGKKYDSRKEANKAWELDQLIKAKKIKSYETHYKIDLYGKNGTKVARYYVDFRVLHNDDVVELLEIKSSATATPTWRLKWKLLQDNLKEEIAHGLVRLTVEY